MSRISTIAPDDCLKEYMFGWYNFAPEAHTKPVYHADAKTKKAGHSPASP